MKNSFPHFGVQSWCFRHFKDNAVVAKKVRGIGLDKIELSGAHIDFNKPETYKDIIDIYKSEGVSIVSIGVQTFEGNDHEKNWFEFVKAAGAKHISTHFRVESYMRAIPKVREWSRKYGVKVGLHCHGGYMFGGQPDVIRHIIALGGPEIGLCMDTAWSLQIGPHRGKDTSNPLLWAKEFAGHITGIHYKDFIFEKNGQWKDVIVGEGNLDLPALNQALKEGHFDGMSVIEYEADVENPDPALKRCVDSMLAKTKA